MKISLFICNKFNIVRYLCRFLQPGLIFSATFDKKLGFPTPNHKIIYTRIMGFDQKHLFRTETSQKPVLKTFYYNNKGTRKVKDIQKLCNKKKNSPFNLIVLNTTNLSNSFHGQISFKDTIFSVLISGEKLLLIGLRNTPMDIYCLSGINLSVFLSP